MSNEKEPEFRSRAASADQWYKNSGDAIEGFLVDIQEGVGKYKSMVYTLKRKDKTMVKTYGSTVIDNQMAGIGMGAYVKIIYKGVEAGKSGTEYKNFEVFDAPSMGTASSYFGTPEPVKTPSVVATSNTKPEAVVNDAPEDDLPF